MHKAWHVATPAAAPAAGAVPAHTLARIDETGAVTIGIREASGALSHQVAEGADAGSRVGVCRRALADGRPVADRRSR